MTLNRITLRLAVVEAAANFFREPYPTLAGPNVFDSKIEPSEQIEDGVAVPLVVIYTDYDKDSWAFRNKSQKKRMLNLTIELLMVQKVESENSDGVYMIGSPTTDSELEVSLDILELQVYRALRDGDSSAGECFRHLCLGFENVISRRGASVENGQRVAARQITIEMDLMRDPQPGVLPPVIADFLDDISAFGSETADQAEELRREYLRPSVDQLSPSAPSGMYLTRDGARALGLAERGAPLLPAAIQWLDPQGRPLR